MKDEVHVERRDDGLCLLTLDRPPANALNAEFLTLIGTRFAELETDDDVRAVVITGKGRIFSAGMDLKVLPGLNQEDQRTTLTAFNKTYGRIYGFSKPLVAAVNGHAIAGGLFFALAADHRVGPIGDFQFGLTEARVGVAFPVAALEIARSEMAPEIARRILLRARTVPADVAAEWGILDELAPPDAVLELAFERARDFATIPRKAYADVKRQLRAPVLDLIDRCLANSDDPLLGDWVSGETAAAAGATLAGGARQ